jgi:hypothetical protein
MPISINCATHVITVPQSYLTLISSPLYELDVNQFRLDLKDWEDSETGIAMPDTHRHNTAVILSGVTYARTLEILAPYTITFEDGTYSVRCVGANHNIADVKNVNSVSLIIGNSAGMISVASGSGLDSGQDAKLTAINAQLMSIESTLNHSDLMRLMLAALAGTSEGVGTANEKYKSIDANTDRIDVTFDETGNRVSVTLTP